MERVTNLDSVGQVSNDEQIEIIEEVDLDEDEMIDIGMPVQMRILSHAQKELERRQYIGSVALLCCVIHALHLHQLLSRCLHSRVTNDTPLRERRRRELMRYLMETEKSRDIIRMGPEASMQIKHYDVLRELFGFDRVGGKKSGTHRMRRKDKEKEKENDGERDNIDPNDSIDDDAYIPEFDTGVFHERREEHPNVDSYSPAGGVSHHSSGTSGSRGTKRKAPMTDLMEDQLERMTSGIGLMADALSKGNCISNQLHDVEKQQIAIAERQVAAIEKHNEILQHSRPRVYTAADVWNMLSELNLLEQFRLQCYEFLCSDEKKKELVFGVPPHLRLQVLFQIMNVTGHHVGSI